jgi:hypothetical protein
MSSTKDRPLRIDRDDPGSLPLATLRIRGGNGGDGAGTELLVVSDSASYTCDRPARACPSDEHVDRLGGKRRALEGVLQGSMARKAECTRGLMTHLDLCVGGVVVSQGIVRVRVLVEDDTAGDAPLQRLGDTDVALRAVPSAPT